MKTKFLSVFALAALLFASCSNDDNDTQGVNDGRVLFSSGVTPQTKVGGANGDQWDSGDAIGIFMRDNTSKAIQSANVKYTTTSTGATATFTSTAPIYYPVNTPAKVDFVAYHPYATLTGDYVYSVNVATQTSQSAIDLMVAKADNGASGYDKTNPSAVNLVFDHKLTKVIFITTPGDGLIAADLANMTVTIEGMNTKAEYNINTDGWSTAPNTVANIATKTAISGTKYEAIVVPESYLAGDVVIKFALNNGDNEVFEYKVPATTFVKAKQHEYTITVQRTGVTVTGTIKAWDPVGAVTGTAN